MRNFAMIVVLGAALAGADARATEAINTFGSDAPLFGEPRRTGVAIRGYDPVAYFEDSAPRAGKDEFVFKWKGADWKFASKEHLEKFKENPEKFAPQYGGYCAYGAAMGALVKIEPDQFKIIDGKLYLNYDADVQKKWSKNPKDFIKKADEKFASLLKAS